MDTAQWPQGIQILKPAAVENARPAGTNTVEKKPRPQKEQALNCPRCNSTNTKFCYYNNYSLSQPRYFCKTCRRYWTEGGSLRNVPVGGGSRKNKRSSSSTTSTTTTTTNDINSISSKKLISPQSFSPQNPKIQQGQDLNLAYNPYNGISEFNVSLPFVPNSSSSNSSHPIPVMELLKSTGNITSFISSETNSIPYNSSGLNFIPVHDFKPNLGFSLDGLENGYGNIQGVDQDHHHDTNSSRNFLFPFEELNRPVSSTNDHQFEQPQQGRGQGDQANGYWNGMLAGGSW